MMSSSSQSLCQFLYQPLYQPLSNITSNPTNIIDLLNEIEIVKSYEFIPDVKYPFRTTTTTTKIKHKSISLPPIQSSTIQSSTINDKRWKLYSIRHHLPSK